MPGGPDGVSVPHAIPPAILAGSVPGGRRLGARRAAAELIVFEDGRVVKAAGYRLLAEELEISLPGGGSYRVELARVDRIVDDEVVVDTVLVEPDPLRAGRRLRPLLPGRAQAALRRRRSTR